MKEARSTELENRVGKGQVVGELPHDGGQAEVGRARQEQHLRVVEETVELELGGSQRPLLNHPPEARAGRHQGIARQLLEPRLATLIEDAGGGGAELSAEALEALRALGYAN